MNFIGRIYSINNLTNVEQIISETREINYTLWCTIITSVYLFCLFYIRKEELEDIFFQLILPIIIYPDTINDVPEKNLLAIYKHKILFCLLLMLVLMIGMFYLFFSIVFYYISPQYIFGF